MSEKIKVILGYFLFRFSKTWILHCDSDHFVKTMMHSMYLDPPQKIFPNKRIFGKYYENKKTFDVISVYPSNYSPSSWLYSAKTTLTYKDIDENSIIVKLDISDSGQYVIFALSSVLTFSMWYDQLTVFKAIFSTFIFSYVFCMLLFWISVIRRWSVISDTIGYTRAKKGRYRPKQAKE